MKEVVREVWSMKTTWRGGGRDGGERVKDGRRERSIPCHAHLVSDRINPLLPVLWKLAVGACKAVD